MVLGDKIFNINENHWWKKFLRLLKVQKCHSLIFGTHKHCQMCPKWIPNGGSYFAETAQPLRQTMSFATNGHSLTKSPSENHKRKIPSLGPPSLDPRPFSSYSSFSSAFSNGRALSKAPVVTEAKQVERGNMTIS